jgi:CRISPR/Cas system CMR-associated protein Cmr5 small subunit
MYQNHEKLISDTLELIQKNKGFELKLEGNQIFQAPVMLKNDNRVLWEMNLFVGINPWNMPLNLWHKMILILTAAFVLIIFVMLMIKIKHESDLEQMREYEEEGQTDFLHEQFATFSESEMEEVEEDYALGAPLEGEDEEYVKEVPESYYEKESERKKDRELSSIIGEVRGHEEKFQKYSSLWKNINQVIENKSYRMALNLYDPKNEDFIPHFQKNIPESAPLTVEKDNWIMQQYVLMGKALMVTSSALSAPPLKEIFNSEEYFDVNSCFIAPLRKDGEVRGIFLLFAPEVLEEDTVREINSLINMG